MIPGIPGRRYPFTTGNDREGGFLKKICDLTWTELEYYRTVCNFTADENTLFDLRAKNIPLERCAEIMNRGIDSTKQLSRKVMDKIRRET